MKITSLTFGYTAILLALITLVSIGCTTGDARPEWLRRSLPSNGQLDTSPSQASWLDGVYTTRVDLLDEQVERPHRAMKTFYDWLTYGNSLRHPTYVYFSLRNSQNLEISFFDQGEIVGRCLITKEHNHLAIGETVEFELEKVTPGGEGATRSTYRLLYNISPGEDGLIFSIDIHEHHRSYFVFNHRRNMTWRLQIESTKDVALPELDEVKVIVPFMPPRDT